MTKASICTIGDEILIGQIVDTNSSAISRALEEVGVRVVRMLSIGDDHEEIISNLDKELSNSEIVICTGGLGPTKDDITKQALAELSGSTHFVENIEQARIVREILKSRGLEVLDTNKLQAMVPDTCEVIPNQNGTAPFMVFRFPENRYGHPAVLYSLPGVPHEALSAIPLIISDIKSHFSLTDIYHRNLMVYGYAESALAKKIEKWEDSLPGDMHLAYLPNTLTGVKLRLSIYSGDKEEEKARIEERIAQLHEILGDAIYSDEEDDLQHALKKLLSGTGKTVSAAESCTGGEISHLITSVPGSSEYYLGSVTSYAIAVKESVLGVPGSLIEEFGVVSGEVAAAMAEGVRRLTGSTYSVSTTGLAGPDGDGEHPSGTVWIGVSGPHGTVVQMRNYHNDRLRNIQRFAASALDLLRRYIIEDQK